MNMRAHEDLLGEANIGGNDLPWKQRATMSGHERPQKRDLAASCSSHVGTAQGKFVSRGTPQKHVGKLIWRATIVTRPHDQIVKNLY